MIPVLLQHVRYMNCTLNMNIQLGNNNNTFNLTTSLTNLKIILIAVKLELNAQKSNNQNLNNHLTIELENIFVVCFEKGGVPGNILPGQMF